MESAFAKDYENGATDYPTEMEALDGYNILVFLVLPPSDNRFYSNDHSI